MKALRNSKVTPVIGLIIGAVIGLICFQLTTVNAGNLEPSAAPGPTMKTLDEVEARIPIPGSVTAAATFVIDEAGSYYLTGNRSCSGRGISVEANNVTIDLNGYVLWGSGTGTYSGIYMNGCTNVEIRNGTICNFAYHGIYEADSVNGGDHRIINVRAIVNKQRGINLVCKGNLVKDCIVSGNLGTGMYVYESSNIIGNIVIGNGGAGIYAVSSCTLQNNTCSDNGDKGIYADNGSTVIGNTCRNNAGHGIHASYGTTVISNTASENDENGIRSSGSSMIINNMVMNNNQSSAVDGAGIFVWTDCTVRGNSLKGNLQQNIYTWGGDNVIENNTVLDSTYGIYFNSTGCFYANNRASGNTTGYGGSLPSGDGDGGGNADF